MMNIIPSERDLESAQALLNESGAKLVLSNLNEILLLPFPEQLQMWLWVALAQPVPAEWLKSLCIAIRDLSGEERELRFCAEDSEGAPQQWGDTTRNEACYKLSLHPPVVGDADGDLPPMAGIEAINIDSIVIAAGDLRREYRSKQGRGLFAPTGKIKPENEAPGLTELLTEQQQINHSAADLILEKIKGPLFLQAGSGPASPSLCLRLDEDTPASWLCGLEVALRLNHDQEVFYRVCEDFRTVSPSLAQALACEMDPAEREILGRPEKGWYRFRLETEDRITAMLVCFYRGRHNIREIALRSPDRERAFSRANNHFRE